MNKTAVVRACELAKAAGLKVTKPPRTTWRDTPLHELWLEDPDGNLVDGISTGKEKTRDIKS